MMIQPSKITEAFGQMAAALRHGAGSSEAGAAARAADDLATETTLFPFGSDHAFAQALDTSSASFTALGADRTVATFHKAQVDMLQAASLVQRQFSSADQARLGQALRHHLPG